MKTFYFVAALVLTSLVFTSCSKGTSGGPSAEPKKPSAPITNSLPTTQSKGTFSIDVPMMATSLKRGETKEVSIGIKRGDGMTQGVSLAFSGAPNGVTLDPAPATIKGDANEVKVMVKTTANAPIGDFIVKVTGHPETGVDATNELKISVSE